MMPNPLHKLADLADIRAGFLTREAVRNNPAGTYCLLQIRDIDRHRETVNMTDMIRISPETRSSLHPLQAGDVIFLAKGANNFAFAVPELPSPTLAASSFFILRPGSLILARYLVWFLNHESTRLLLSRLATTGAHMPIIRRDTLESLEIPLPPLAVQKTIAELDILRIQEHILLSDLAEKKEALISTLSLSTVRRSIGNATPKEGTAHE